MECLYSIYSCPDFSRFWSRDWIGIYSVLAILASLYAGYGLIKVIQAPDTTNNWASMGAFGERIYLRIVTLSLFLLTT
ncbi:hypothetical protein O9929_27215 [Vibrio lentus]|nr:hypothetical protein [Vibrio lentus]